ATVSTQFDVSAGIETGSSDIEVVANGIASAKTAITVSPNGGSLTFAPLTSDKASPQAAGTTITFTASASGGTAPYQYKWWVKNGSTWTMMQNWSSSATFAWTPATAYPSEVVEVWGRSAGNNADTYEAYQDLAFTITP